MYNKMTPCLVLLDDFLGHLIHQFIVRCLTSKLFRLSFKWPFSYHFRRTMDHLQIFCWRCVPGHNINFTMLQRRVEKMPINAWWSFRLLWRCINSIPRSDINLYISPESAIRALTIFTCVHMHKLLKLHLHC